MAESDLNDVRILYVEDDDGQARLLQRRLSRLGFIVDVATTGEEALAKFDPAAHQAVLLDYTLPRMSGLDVLKQLHPVNGEPIVIMLTAGGNEQLALAALQAGAEDYIVKDVGQTYFELLPHVISSALIKLNLRNQTKAQNKQLSYYVGELERRNAALEQEIADRRALEILLRDAKESAEDANVAKSEFLANMSHEIRTPMNAVVGLSNILGLSKPLTDRQREFIGTLQTSADTLLALINDLLDISRIEARTVDLETIPFDICQILKEIVGILSVRTREKGIDLHIDDAKVQGRIYLGDPNRLRQILLNLCSNAIKFTEAGSVRVSVETHAMHDPRHETVSIRVEDTGIGIPPEKLGTVFEKFVQGDSSINRKYGGTGLGLAITRTLTEIMGGAIEVESEAGRGSAFTVRLPLALAKPEGQEAAGEASGPAVAAAGVQKLVLIVEDYMPNVIVAASFLEQFGYDYDTASNGTEALAKLKARGYAAVLMDVQMHGMNGLDATRLIREREQAEGLPHLPVIGLTAHVLAGDRERCLDAGMDDYITKPFQPDTLKQALQNQIA